VTSSDGRSRSWVNQIHQGDAAETLAEMPDSSVHMAMTSPPYFGLRDYGVDGQIGLEDSLEEYIDDLLEVATELRRVLRDDGSWWLNLGDSFAGSWGAQSKDDEANHRDRDAYPGKSPARTGTLRRKSKMLVPHRVAIAFEGAGWIVRSDAVWAKPNPMPHPVKDRLHEHKEFVFHLTPEPDYWFDLDAVREPHKETSVQRSAHNYESSSYGSMHMPREDERESVTMDAEDALHPNGKNPGDVLEIPVKAFPEAHFAVYPPELCETPIKSSCPPKVCAACGAPYEFETSDADLLKNPNDRDKKARALELYDRSSLTRDHLEAARDVGLHDEEISNHDSDGGYGKVDEETARLAQEARDVLGAYTREFFTGERKRTGWVQICDCDTDEAQPGIVLDPFAGAGTTCMVAKDLGRRFVGIDLNPDYVAMAQKRVGVTVDEPERLLEDDAQTTFVQTDGGCNDRSLRPETSQEVTDE
jgi:DNA modification methylase